MGKVNDSGGHAHYLYVGVGDQSLHSTSPPDPTPSMTFVQSKIRIGVDVGGTNTDAVVVDLSPGAERVILAATKTPTTSEVSLGVQKSIETVLDRASHIPRKSIQSVNIGTTHFVNALIQRSATHLERVAVIRLCGSFTQSTPPFAGFPYELRALLQGPHFFVNGGLQIDGSQIAEVRRVSGTPTIADFRGRCRSNRARLQRDRCPGLNLES